MPGRATLWGFDGKAETEGPVERRTSGHHRAQDFARHAVTRTYPKNTVVVSEGDDTDSLYIIVSGRVKIYVSDEKGKEIVLNESGRGEFFGEMVLDEGPRSASVMTLEPTEFLVVPKDDFRGFVTNSPEFALHLIPKLIARVRALTNDVKSLALMDEDGRVARLLLDLAVDRDGTLVIENRPTQQEMASRIGASREMISRILSDLAKGGYIVSDGDRITIAKRLPRGPVGSAAGRVNPSHLSSGLLTGPAHKGCTQWGHADSEPRGRDSWESRLPAAAAARR